MTSLWFDRAFYCVLFHPVFLFQPSRSFFTILKRGLFKTIVLLKGWDNTFHVYSGLLNSYHWGFTLPEKSPWWPSDHHVLGQRPSTTSATWTCDEASDFGNWIQSWLCTSCTENYSNIQWKIWKYAGICIFYGSNLGVFSSFDRGTSPGPDPVFPARRRCRSGRSQQLGKLCATWARQGSCSCQAGTCEVGQVACFAQMDLQPPESLKTWIEAWYLRVSPSNMCFFHGIQPSKVEMNGI